MSFKTLVNDVKNRLRNGGKEHFEIVFNEDLASILKNSRLLVSVPWSSVKRIIVGKLDRLTYDPIVICLTDSNNERNGVEFEEFMDGFQDFMAEVNRRYAIKPDWINRVNHDAFAPNWETLWESNVQNEK
jgi:hypothetical protein